MFEKIYNILVSFLGESKQEGYDSSIDQYQFNCPQCADENGGIPDGKHNLEVNLKIHKFQCWRCADTDGTKGTIGYLIKRFGSRRLYAEYREEMEALRKRKLYTFEDWDEAPVDNYEKFISLPKTYSKIELSNPSLDKRLVKYLEKRKIDQNIINRYNIGYTSWEPEFPRWSNRVIIPSYDSYGDLNYWVGRDFTGKAFQKYCNCDFDKKQIIFQESLIDWDAPIYLVEGAIDCIYLHNSISLLGKSLNKESVLYNALIKKANSEIIICLDKDTQDYETYKICTLLSYNTKFKNKIQHIILNNTEIPYKDFGEAYEAEGKEGIIKIIKNKEKFSEINLTLWLKK